jgi:hypothetical protein
MNAEVRSPLCPNIQDRLALQVVGLSASDAADNKGGKEARKLLDYRDDLLSFPRVFGRAKPMHSEGKASVNLSNKMGTSKGVPPGHRSAEGSHVLLSNVVY